MRVFCKKFVTKVNYFFLKQIALKANHKINILLNKNETNI